MFNPLRKPSVKDSSALKVQRLAQLAIDLRAGKNFPITRLTVLKSFCQDPTAAAQFSVHLSRLAGKRMKASKFKPLMTKAVRNMSAALKMPPSRARPFLFDLHGELVTSQNEHRPANWGSVRIIWSQDVLLAEYVCQCFLDPQNSAYWGYQVAKHYAERYDSKYGTGLIPASAPLVEDIVQFWSRT